MPRLVALRTSQSKTNFFWAKMCLQPSILARRGGCFTRRASLAPAENGAAQGSLVASLSQLLVRSAVPIDLLFAITNKPEENKSGRTSKCFSHSCSHVPEPGESDGHLCIARMLTEHLMDTTGCGHGWAWKCLAPEPAYAVKHTSGFDVGQCEGQEAAQVRRQRKARPAKHQDESECQAQARHVSARSFGGQRRGSQRLQLDRRER